MIIMESHLYRHYRVIVEYLISAMIESHIFHRVIRCIECNSIMHSYYCVKKKNNKKQKYFFVRCKNKICSLYDMNYNTKKIEEDFVRILKQINKTDLLKKEKLKVPYIENQKEIDEIDKTINKLNNQEETIRFNY